MKERVPDFKPRDTRGQARRDNGSNKRRGGGIADEFEALLSMRDQLVPEATTEQLRTDEKSEDLPSKDDGKGIER